VGQRGIIVAIAIGIAGAAVYYFAIYQPPRRGTDREQVLRLIADVEKAVEQGRPSGVMEHISQDYSDQHGLSRSMVQRMVIAGARDRRRMNLSVEVPEVEVSGDSATFVADVEYTVDGQPSIRTLTVTAMLRREGGRWMVVRADGWQGAEAAYY
jgi:ketosteroid isomerase-like protein